MITRRPILLLATAALFAAQNLTSAAAPKSYQVTGPVLELTDTTIVVQKDNEKWEIARDPKVKVTGDLKVGSKVTVMYTMSAKSIEVKPEAAASAPATPTPAPKPATPAPAAKPESTPKAGKPAKKA